MEYQDPFYCTFIRDEENDKTIKTPKKTTGRNITVLIKI